MRPPLEDLEKELKATRQNAGGFGDAGRSSPQSIGAGLLTKIMEEIEDQIKDQYAEHQLKIETIQIMADELSDLSGANKPIEVKVVRPGPKGVANSGRTDIGEMLEKKGKDRHRGIKEVNTNVFAGNPDLIVQFDAAKAERLGLKPDAVARQLRAMFLGQIAAKAQESSARITDVPRSLPRFRFALAPAASTPNSSGGSGSFCRRDAATPVGLPPGLSGPARAVPLSALATVTPVRSPDQLLREGQQPAIFVTAELNEEEAGLGSVVADIRTWMADMHLPAGYRWELGGHYLRQQEAFNSLLIVMVVAALLVFIMLAFQFRSVTLPILIFLTQPLSLVSGLLALWLTNTPLNVSSYMGAILLIGLDMKNGILLVEYIQQLRTEGMELRPALILAGRTRFRPILMTSLAAILGLAPLALGIGPGADATAARDHGHRRFNGQHAVHAHDNSGRLSCFATWESKEKCCWADLRVGANEWTFSDHFWRKGQLLTSLPANSLTANEVVEIQTIADKYNTTIDVVGSRAAGKGLNIETNLPMKISVPAGEPYRSDIDFRIDAAHPEAEALIKDLNNVGNYAGAAGTKWSSNPATPGGRATKAPFIQFRAVV